MTPTKLTVGPLVEFDTYGLPWRASTRAESPYYFAEGHARLWVEFNDREASGMNVVEFDRRNGWVRQVLFPGTAHAQDVQLFGRVTVRWRLEERP